MNAPREIRLPEATPPTITRVVTLSIFKDDPRPELTWQVAETHPFVAELNIVRMFHDERGGVEVYAVTKDGRAGTRYTLSQAIVRLVEEAMPLNVFVEELEAAEAGADDSDDGGGDDNNNDNDNEPSEDNIGEDRQTAPPPIHVVAPNGQA